MHGTKKRLKDLPFHDILFGIWRLAGYFVRERRVSTDEIIEHCHEIAQK
jgi:hypothetical protein